MPEIAGLASGRGRTLGHLADRRPAGAALSVVIADDPDAPVLERAAERGIETVVVETAPEMDREEHERRVLQALSGVDPDLIALDGYQPTLSETFLDAAPPTVAAHPSLLPAFSGPDPHQQALDAGVTVSGCTVHLVTADEPPQRGPILAQEPVSVFPGDDRETLAERVLTEGAFRAYPRAVEGLLTGRISVENGQAHREESAGAFPDRRLTSTDRHRDLRYGENPHQRGALYADRSVEGASVVGADQLNEGAKGLSYNNYNDADAALNLVREFEGPAAAVIKHTNPAGCALGETVAEAYDRALSTDAKSAFGGIVALNRECTVEAADSIVDSYKEAVVAPGYTEAALSVLRESEDLRVLDVGELSGAVPGQVEKPLVGGRLVQDRDTQSLSPADLETVTEREPTEEEIESLLFAWQTAKHVKSNAIVLAQGTETVGIGMGQASRVDAVELATRKADRDAEGKAAAGSVLASDAFFPFPDGVELAAEAGVEAVVQPGGSVNDDAVIEAADEHGLSMVFTGSRAFRHD
jgi:phosphoribosylaminoimidazolecarboxamide formyltransferase/IMP cyclohydrolase